MQHKGEPKARRGGGRTGEAQPPLFARLCAKSKNPPGRRVFVKWSGRLDLLGPSWPSPFGRAMRRVRKSPPAISGEPARIRLPSNAPASDSSPLTSDKLKRPDTKRCRAFLKWSGRLDLNQRPLAPHASALARLRYAPTYGEATEVAERSGKFNQKVAASPARAARTRAGRASSLAESSMIS